MLKKRQKIYFGIFWIVLITSFLFFATLLMLVANGYHLNSKNFKLEKTGMIVLDGSPDSFNIIINGNKKLGNFPYRMSKLFPGRYELKIDKENYQPWEKVYQIDGGQAIVNEGIFLFFEDDKIVKKDEDVSIIPKIQKEYTKQNKNIEIKTNELYYQSQLVTRFSNALESVIRDSRTEYYIFQTDNNIYTIDKDGQNEVKLITLSNSEPSSFYISGNILYFLENGRAFSASIR